MAITSKKTGALILLKKLGSFWRNHDFKEQITNILLLISLLLIRFETEVQIGPLSVNKETQRTRKSFFDEYIWMSTLFGTQYVAGVHRLLSKND